MKKLPLYVIGTVKRSLQGNSNKETVWQLKGNAYVPINEDSSVKPLPIEHAISDLQNGYLEEYNPLFTSELKEKWKTKIHHKSK